MIKKKIQNMLLIELIQTFGKFLIGLIMNLKNMIFEYGLFDLNRYLSKARNE